MMTCGPNVFSIFTNDDKLLNLKAVYASSGDPLDLTDCTEIDIALPNADGTFSHRLLSLGQVVKGTPNLLGKFSALIPHSTSAILNVGEFQTFEVKFTVSGQSFIVPYEKALSVFQGF